MRRCQGNVAAADFNFAISCSKAAVLLRIIAVPFPATRIHMLPAGDNGYIKHKPFAVTAAVSRLSKLSRPLKRRANRLGKKSFLHMKMSDDEPF